MWKLIVAASLALAVTATSAAAQPHVPAPGHPCPRTFTLAQFKRAVHATYRGTRSPPVGAYAALWRYARCQRYPSTESRARGVWEVARRAWEARRHPWSTAYVSWYDDGGTHCCGTYAYYGVADCGSSGPCYSQGTQIEFCDRKCIVATVDDHGPYAPPREWDLNQNTAAAIGFGGLGTVRWRIRR